MSPKDTNPPIAVTLPSADLIQYRFDQMEKRFDHLEAALQAISNRFVTRDEAKLLTRELESRVIDLEASRRTQQKYIWGTFLAVFGAMATAVATFWIHK